MRVLKGLLPLVFGALVATSAAGASTTGLTWFGTYAGACRASGLWSSVNPPVGYTTSDGAINNCIADPVGSGQRVLEMKVTPETCGWDCEQRMDWDSPRFITPGSSYYISVPILVPTSFPCRIGTSIGTGVMFNEQFGMPTKDSPSNALSVQEARTGCVQFAFSGNTSGVAGGGHQLWRGAPAADGHWHDFIEHFVASTNPAVGEIQLWEDGHPITFNTCTNTSVLTGCGTTTLHYPTLIPGATDQSNNWVQLNNYRNNSPSGYTSTIYHGAAAAGSTYAAVASTLVKAPYGP